MPIVRPGRPGYIYLPKYNYIASWKITVTDPVTSQVWDLTSYYMDLSITWGLKSLAYCNINLSNDTGRWLDIWDGGETVEVWAEYADTATPSISMFKGKLDSILFNYGSNGYTAIVKARQVPELADIKFINQFDNALCSDATVAIVEGDYSDYVTTNNVNATTQTITTNFSNMSGIQAFGTLADKSNSDIYIDLDDDVNLFEKESVINTEEYIAQGLNLLSLNNYGVNNATIFNKVVVYGKEDNNIILIKTEEDITSQTNLWRKDLIITDNALSTMGEVQDKADIELANGISTEPEGRAICLGMISLRPGDMINVSAPYVGANGPHKVSTFTHTFSVGGGFTTSIALSKRSNNLDILFKNRIDAEQRLRPFGNLNSMDNSYTVYFDEDPSEVTHSNTEIVDNKLQLVSGENSGTALFNTFNSDTIITQCELRVMSNYPQDQLCIYSVSNDAGATWLTLNPGVITVFATTGSELKFKIDFIGDANTRPSFDKICVLYK